MCIHRSQDWSRLFKVDSIREGFKNNEKKMVGFIHPGWLAGVSRGPISNPPKNIVFKKEYKDVQNGLIHPEN